MCLKIKFIWPKNHIWVLDHATTQASVHESGCLENICYGVEPQINKKDRLALTIITYTLNRLGMQPFCRSLQEGDSPKDWPFNLKGAMVFTQIFFFTLCLKHFIFCRFMTKYSFWNLPEFFLGKSWIRIFFAKIFFFLKIQHQNIF